MDKEKEKEKTRERVRRYRERQKAVTDTDVTVSNVTAKMVCRCQFYKMVNGQMVCAQCGRLPQKKSEDRIRRGIHCKM